MRVSNVRHIRKAGAVAAVAALAFAGIGTVGAGSAYAGTKGVSAGSDSQWAMTYTCDTIAVLAADPTFPYATGAVSIMGTGNCAASGGAPVNTQIVTNPVSLVQRSDGTVYHCYGGGYYAMSFLNLPASVGSVACVLAS